jgi:hypothetical protein
VHIGVYKDRLMIQTRFKDSRFLGLGEASKHLGEIERKCEFLAERNFEALPAFPILSVSIMHSEPALSQFQNKKRREV